jgi:predicted lipoprotein with Yx(FWY)xxD motif
MRLGKISTRNRAAALFLGGMLILAAGPCCGQGGAMPDGVKIVNGALADAKGMTLYVFDYDTQPGRSACAAGCLVQWPALAASPDAKPSGDWTVISRSDGSKQWAYKDKPLYTYFQDTKPGDKNGDGNSQVWHTAVP